jgi:CheY-like chemotaxis protein
MDTSRESQASSVLLAEDDSVNRKIAWQILRNLGYHVTVVGTSKEALNAFQRFHFDLVILGCECSGLDGYETASLIRQEESREIHTPIIGLTASTLQSDRKRREAASMDDYIAIPIQPRNVVAVLKRWDKNDKCCSHHKPTAIDRSMIRSC